MRNGSPGGRGMGYESFRGVSNSALALSEVTLDEAEREVLGEFSKKG